MPFDDTNQRTDYTTIYRERRERAAAVWANVPRYVFTMAGWECGSKACALGWLAHEAHDGWTWLEGEVRIPVAPGGRLAFEGAARYFGISVAQATACFGGERAGALFLGRWFPGRISPADVSRALLALPYPE